MEIYRSFRYYKIDIRKYFDAVDNAVSDDDKEKSYLDLFNYYYNGFINMKDFSELKLITDNKELLNKLIVFVNDFITITKLRTEDLFNLLYNLAIEFFEKSYYYTALKLFKIVLTIKSLSLENKCKCTLSLAELYDEIGDIKSADILLNSFIFINDHPDNNKLLSKIYSLLINIQLNYMYNYDKTELTDKVYFEKLDDYLSKIKIANSYDTDNLYTYYLYGQITCKMASHKINNKEINDLYDKAISKYNEAIKIILEINERDFDKNDELQLFS